MKVIGFGRTSYSLLFPFLMPLFWFLRSYLSSRFPLMEGKRNLIYHPIFFSFITIIGDLFAGSLSILPYCIQRKHKKEIEIHKSTIPLLQRTFLFSKITKIKISFQIYLIISIVSLFEVTMLSGLLILGFYASPDIGFQMNISLIIFEAILSKVILKYSVYRHHIVSISLIIVGLFLIFYESVTLGFGDNPDERYSFVYYLSFLFIYIILALLDVAQKYVMEKKYYTPYKLALLQGSFSFVYFWILFIFFSNYECKWEFCNDSTLSSSHFIAIEPIILTFKSFFQYNSFITFLTLLAYEIICGGYIICLFLTIYFYTPTHRSVADSLTSFISWIISNVEQKKLSLYSFIGYILVIISCLIYNEIFILYFWGMETYTKKEIENRSDMEQLISEDPEDINTELSLIE